jgi:hypothetical protein
MAAARPPRFAWRDRIVLGAFNLLLGNEGVGKGTFACALLAQWTRGRVPGDLKDQPVVVGIVGDEDSFTGVWTPRLFAAKADLDRVVRIERPDGGLISFRDHRSDLAELVDREGIRVLYFDSLVDNLGVGVDDWRAKQVREALEPARWIARELDIAVVGSLHPNKSGDTFRQLVSGSHAFNALSRSSLLIAEDPDHPGERVVVRGKGNLASSPAAIRFRIESRTFMANGYEFNVPRAVDFTNGGKLTADDLLATTRATNAETQIGSAEALLEDLLRPTGDWRPVQEIYAACAAEGFNERTVKYAKKRLGIEHKRESKKGGSTLWRWPKPPEPVLSGPACPTTATGAQASEATEDSPMGDPDLPALRAGEAAEADSGEVT